MTVETYKPQQAELQRNETIADISESMNLKLSELLYDSFGVRLSNKARSEMYSFVENMIPKNLVPKISYFSNDPENDLENDSYSDEIDDI